ncbi:Bifunctional pinoresinol-lariciresinol reductase 2, partial [Nymphaea thermarum]
HQIFLLTGATTHASIHKLPLLLSYKQAGATLVEASLDHHESLVSLLSGIDYVISAIAENQIEQQLKLVRAIKQISSFRIWSGPCLPDFMEDSIVPGSVLFEQKRRVRRAVEESGIPHTYVVAHCFAGYFLSGLANFGRFWPPAAKVQILPLPIPSLMPLTASKCLVLLLKYNH